MISTGDHNVLYTGVARLNGLVLAGGKSVRMGGRDKGALQWHGKEQRLYMADLLRPFCNAVFISCRPEQQQQISLESYDSIPDIYEGSGPCGAILSSFNHDPNAAWLVIACDLPLMGPETLAQLVAERDPACMATAFESPHDGLPEPLVAIWEPAAHPILLAALEKGYRCPRKALINNPLKLIQAKNKRTLMNVNTPQEFAEAQAILAERNAVRHAD